VIIVVIIAIIMIITIILYLHDRTALRSGTEISLPIHFNLGLPGWNHVTFMLQKCIPCPMEKATPWVGFLYLTSQSKTDTRWKEKLQV